MVAPPPHLHDPDVIVMKFGGTSVGDPRSIRQVVQIVRGQLARRPVVVVSALAGVTDLLLGLADRAIAGEADAQAIVDRHRAVLLDLELPPDLLDPLLQELSDLARGVRLVGEATPKARDALASYGERLSARIVAAALRRDGVAATAVDASAAGLLTDSSFGRARPLPDDGRLGAHLRSVDGVPVVTGFLGADANGNVTTLGRNGSDFSAAWIGAAVDAEQIQIWKDVDGVRTADPRLVPDALPIARMSFDDVADLASFGSKVLHPAAMAPAMRSGIPMCVRNTKAPDGEGTTITAMAPGDLPAVHAIAHRDDVALVTARSQRLASQHAFLARVFRELDELGCDVGPVAVGEAAVTLAVAAGDARAVVARLSASLEVDLVAGCAVVGVIGAAAALEAGAAAAVLDALAAARVPVRCAGLGPRRSTFAFVVDRDRLVEVVRLLHHRFFAT